MAVAIIQLPPDSTGKMIAARSYTESANTVYAQAGYITTDTAGGNPAAVQNTAPTSEYGLVVRPIPSGTQTVASSTLNTSITLNTTSTSNTSSVIDVSNITVLGFMVGDTSSSVLGGSATIKLRASIDGTNWDPNVYARGSGGDAGTLSSNISFKQIYKVDVAGWKYVQFTVFNAGTDTALPIVLYGLSSASKTVSQGNGAGNSTPLNPWQTKDAGLPTALGQTTMAASTSVAIASDQTGVATRGSILTLQTTNLTTATSSTATGLSTAGNVTLTVHGTYGFTATPPTYIFEASDDSGTTWYAITAIREDTGIQEQTGTLAANTIRTWNCALAGYDQVRFRLTAWGTPSGTLITRWTPGGLLFEPPATHIPNQRVQFTCAIVNDTMTTTDAVRTTLIATRDYVAAAAAATIAVTTGKRLRLTGWTMVTKAPSTTAMGGQYNLRVNPSGTAVVGSPLVATIAAGLIGTQVAQNATSVSADFPDGGVELSGLQQFTVSGMGIASAGYYLTINGYEY